MMTVQHANTICREEYVLCKACQPWRQYQEVPFAREPLMSPQVFQVEILVETFRPGNQHRTAVVKAEVVESETSRCRRPAPPFPAGKKMLGKNGQFL